MDPREQFSRQFIEGGQARGVPPEQIRVGLGNALRDWDRQQAPSAQPTQQPGFLTRLAKAVVDPAVKYGKFVGAGTVQAPVLAATGGKINIPFMSERELEQAGSGDIRRAGQMGLKRSLGAASYAVPIGKTLPAALALGGTMGALRGAAAGETAEIRPREVGVGAAAGAIGGGIAYGGQALVRAFGRGLATTGKNLTLRIIRASKTQQRGFLKQTGQSLENFIVKHNLFSKGVEPVDDLIKPLMDQYDDAAIESGKQIPAQKLFNEFNKRIALLKNVPTTETQRTAERLSSELALAQQKFGTGKIPLAAVTQTRRQIDDLLKKSAFNQPVLDQLVNKHIRDVYKSTIDTATEGATKELGKQINNLLAYRAIAELQQGLGRGNLPIGLLQQLGLLGGGAILGGGGGFATGRSVESAVKGALIGLGFTAAINNPKVIGLATKTLLEAGGKMAGFQLPDFLSRIIQQGITGGVLQSREQPQ